MYTIANLILGTHAPWTAEGTNQVALALVKANPDRYRQDDESDEDLFQAAACGEVEAFEDESWHVQYHGGADCRPVWFGELIETFDESNHIAFEYISDAAARVTPHMLGKVRQLYNQLPEAVRALCPPFGVYIVWSSS